MIPHTFTLTDFAFTPVIALTAEEIASLDQTGKLPEAKPVEQVETVNEVTEEKVEEVVAEEPKVEEVVTETTETVAEEPKSEE